MVWTASLNVDLRPFRNTSFLCFLTLIPLYLSATACSCFPRLTSMFYGLTNSPIFPTHPNPYLWLNNTAVVSIFLDNQQRHHLTTKKTKNKNVVKIPLSPPTVDSIKHSFLQQSNFFLPIRTRLGGSPTCLHETLHPVYTCTFEQV